MEKFLKIFTINQLPIIDISKIHNLKYHFDSTYFFQRRTQ